MEHPQKPATAKPERIASRILRRVLARNRELTIDAAIEVAMGLFFTALTSGVVYCIAWFVCWQVGGRSFPASKAALGVTGMFVLVGVISAWRNVDPFAGLKPMSDAEHLAFAVSHAVNGSVYANRHTVAGLASLLQAGPANLVGALRSWLHRLPCDPPVIEQAAGILGACRPEVDLKKMECSLHAAVLLRRLNLIVPRGDSTVVAVTESGREIVS